MPQTAHMTAARADIVDLDDLMFSSSTSRFMGEQGPNAEPAGVSYVSAEMTLQYWGEDGENDEPEEIVIARASCHLVNLNKVASMFEALDPISGELARMAEFADDVLDSRLTQRFLVVGGWRVRAARGRAHAQGRSHWDARWRRNGGRGGTTPS